jgi:hypothetical protein
MRAQPRRWSTPFGRWIRRIGVREITSRLGAAGQPVTAQAVYGWVAGTRQPRPDLAAILAGMSGGAIRMEDVYSHRRKALPRSDGADQLLVPSQSVA